MKINVYAIRSALSYGDLISTESKKFIGALEKSTGYEFNVTSDLSDLEKDDLGLILVQSGGSEAEFKAFQPEVKGPYYLLTYGSNNSLAASMEILSYIRKNGLEGEILHGETDYITKRLIELVAKKKKYKKECPRLGVIGRPSDWLISSDVDYSKAREVLGVELVDLTIAELINTYTGLNVQLKEGRLNADFDKDELNKAYRIYIAIKTMAEDHKLSGLTVRCFDILEPLHSTACLGLALLNEKNIVSACEGDVPALLTMYTVQKVVGEHGFQANPCWIDAEKSEMILAHCTVPMDMCETYSFNTHFESNIGVGVKGELKTGDITIVKIGAKLNEFYCEEGTLVNNLSRKDLCRTQIRIKLDGDVNYFLNTPLGNHHIVIYGHHKKELSEYLTKRGLTSIN